MDEQLFTCAGCGWKFRASPDGEWIDAETGEHTYPDYGNIREGLYCEACRESDLGSASSIVRYGPDGKDTVRYGDCFAVDAETGDEPPEWFREKFADRAWHGTDGWRGYHESAFRDLEKFASGWLTGYPDETTTHKVRAIEFSEWLNDDASETPVPFYWVFEPTSNVFSVSSDILVAEEDRDAFVAWLEQNDFDPGEIQEAFG